MYSSEDNNIEVFTYVFSGKDIVLYLNYGVTDNASDYDSEMIISVDGEEVKTCFADKENRDPILETSELNMENVNKLTITIKGNIKLWDVTFKEMKYW